MAADGQNITLKTLALPRAGDARESGAGSQNRTDVASLEGSCSTTELYPQSVVRRRIKGRPQTGVKQFHDESRGAGPWPEEPGSQESRREEASKGAGREQADRITTCRPLEAA